MPLGETGHFVSGVPWYECSACGYRHSQRAYAEQCCSYECESCGSLHAYEEDAENCCMFTCTNCGANWETEEQADNCCVEIRLQREYEEEQRSYPREILSDPVRWWITIPDIPGRPARICSVEQELSTGGTRVARLLHDMQISPHNRIRPYSSDTDSGTAIVKSDSSLPENGGEVLYARFNLASRAHSERFSRAIWYLRALKRIGQVATSRNAGTHIHISATTAGLGPTFGPREMANVYEIFSFCEDVLFRLAAAGWQGHRGVRYTAPIPKDGEMGPGKLAKNAMRGRHFSLNFQRLLNAAQRCQCGACMVGDWAECECGALSNGTIEWRIFNATTKPETMHGWLLLAHAITAKAFDYTLGELEPNGFQRTDAERHGWILGWILNECPLLPDERQIILSLAKRSPGLDLNWDEFEEQYLLNRESDDAGDDDVYPSQ